MNSINDFINQALSTLDRIEYNVSKTKSLMENDALSLIKLCRDTIKIYYTTSPRLSETYIEKLSDKEFQNMLYKMCKIKYPELSNLYFNIDEEFPKTYIEIKYKNNIKEQD